MNKLLFITIWLVSAFVSDAATYYVDNDAGNDASAGTSTGTAWQRCPGDATATGTAASTALVAGDTVIFKGGVNYKRTITLSKSGTLGSRIVFDGNSAGSWGTGKAVLNFTNHPTDQIGFATSAGVSNITIKNFEFTEIGGYHVLPATNGCSAPVTTPKWGAGIYLSTSNTMDVTIQDCYFHEIGEWNPVDPFEDAVIDGAGIGLNNAHRVTITGCEFTRMFNAISVKTSSATGIGTSDITITNCNSHNYVAWGVDMAATANGCTLSNLVIIASDFHDYQEYDLGQWAGCGERPHSDGIFIRNAYATNTWAGWNRIEGCRFYNTNAVGGGSACISITEGPSFDIVNNLFMNTVHGRTIYLHNGAHPGDAAQTNNIWGNTFWNDHTAINFVRGGYDLGWISVKNNIFYDTRTGSGSTYILYSEETDDSMVPDELDYNLYITFNTGGTIWKNDYQSDYELTFAEMQAYGYEAHGLTVDPVFVDRTQGVGINILNNDLRLQSTSPAINAGTTIAALAWDKYRTARPQGAAYDIGFYEYIPNQPSVGVTISTGIPNSKADF